jgi:hypothetical protein
MFQLVGLFIGLFGTLVIGYSVFASFGHIDFLAHGSLVVAYRHPRGHIVNWAVHAALDQGTF